MSVTLLLPIALGFVAVLQGSLNRRIAAHIGLPATVALAHAVAFLCACAVWLWMRSSPSSFPNGFLPSASGGRAEWWYLVPGILGFLFVCGIPIAFARLGVFQSLQLLIVAQLAIGLVWDQLVEGRPVSAIRIVGAVITAIGALLVLRR